MYISLFYGTPDDYVQVACQQERYLEKMLAMGWKKSPEELQPKETKQRASHESRRPN